jgi:hypothetical protein
MSLTSMLYSQADDIWITYNEMIIFMLKSEVLALKSRGQSVVWDGFVRKTEFALSFSTE